MCRGTYPLLPFNNLLFNIIFTHWLENNSPGLPHMKEKIFLINNNIKNVIHKEIKLINASFASIDRSPLVKIQKRSLKKKKKKNEKVICNGMRVNKQWQFWGGWTTPLRVDKKLERAQIYKTSCHCNSLRVVMPQIAVCSFFLLSHILLYTSSLSVHPIHSSTAHTLA